MDPEVVVLGRGDGHSLVLAVDTWEARYHQMHGTKHPVEMDWGSLVEAVSWCSKGQSRAPLPGEKI